MVAHVANHVAEEQASRETAGACQHPARNRTEAISRMTETDWILTRRTGSSRSDVEAASSRPRTRLRTPAASSAARTLHRTLLPRTLAAVPAGCCRTNRVLPVPAEVPTAGRIAAKVAVAVADATRTRRRDGPRSTGAGWPACRRRRGSCTGPTIACPTRLISSGERATPMDIGDGPDPARRERSVVAPPAS